MTDENKDQVSIRLNKIIGGLQEVLNQKQLEKILVDPLYEPVCYFGTAPTGTLHLGYLFQMLKISDIIEANCRIKILIADLHAYLDSMKSSLSQLEARTEYYIEMIKQLLLRLNVDISKVEFIKGTSFQLSKEYMMDVFRANSMITYSDARHAGAEVVRQSDNPIMNSLLYPSLQVLDMHYLKADMFLGGVDQRKINAFGLELLPKLGYKKGIYLMNPMISALSNSATDGSAKMSSSEVKSKIDILDSEKVIKKKVNQSYCLPGDIKNNTPLVLTEKLIFPILNKLKVNFIINRPEKHGGKIEYESFDTLKNDFEQLKLHPMDLKTGLIHCIDFILTPIRQKFQEKELQDLVKTAYPNFN